MQQATTIRVSRRYRAVTILSTASLALTLLVALVGLWATARQSTAPAPAPALTQTQLRPATSPHFVDEAAYVPVVEEYLSPALDETYLPFDQASATPAPAAHTQPASFASPHFADEAAYVPVVEEYRSPALDETYLPFTSVIVAPRFTSPLSARILVDELAGSTHTFAIMEAHPGDAGPFTLTAGPR